MNIAIKLMKLAGVTLADFRKLSKDERTLLWTMVIMNYEIAFSPLDYPDTD